MAKLHTREILDYERSCRPVWSERIRDPHIALPGDQIHWKHLGSWRDGIVVEVHTDGSVPKVIVIR